MREVNWRGNNRSSIRYAKREERRKLCVRDGQNCPGQIQREGERKIR